jgi:DNA-binding NarL/FixJ family response regulator
MRIMIVDDHEVVREGLIATLAESGRHVVGAVGTSAEAVALARRTLPDVAIVDLRLPDATGEELCSRLRALIPGIAVVILSTYLSEGAIRGALRAGAAAYVTKAAGIGRLRSTLDAIARSEHAPGQDEAPLIVRQLHEVVASRMDDGRPTPQQQRVLELAADGLTNREIGEQLHITESTVRFHMQRLKETLRARTTTELIAKAIRTGLILPAPEDEAVRQ